LLQVWATLAQAEQLGGRIVQPVQQVPGVTFGVFADPHGYLTGVAANWLRLTPGAGLSSSTNLGWGCRRHRGGLR
jgi:hypothetical protein